jgi:hypothetical protein
MFVLGRRRMAARFETKLALPVVPFLRKKFNVASAPHAILLTSDL